MYSFSPELASQLASPEGVRPALESDIPAISRLVERFARRYNGVSLRDGTWWKHNTAVYNFRFDGSEDLKTSNSPWVHESGGEIDGYAYFQMSQTEDQSILDVKEIIDDNPSARRSILSRFAAAGVSSIQFCAPMDDGFLQELSNPRSAKSGIQAGFQFRVIDPLAALEHRTTDPKLTGNLSFTVADPVLGAQEFTIQAEDGKITRSRSRLTDHLSMSIQTFSQLYSGYMRPTRALELGRVEASSTSAIHFAEQLFPDVMPYRSLMELG
jgi:predicted acetyltransferase